MFLLPSIRLFGYYVVHLSDTFPLYAFHRLQVLNVSSPLHGIPPITSSEKFQSNTSMHCTGCCLSEQSHYFQSPDWHNRQHQDGWKQKRGKHLLSSLLPHYTILHSLTWGTLAIFALQLTWQIPWLSSVPVVGRENKPPWLDSFYSSLLCHQHSVLAAAPANCPSGQKGPCFLLAMIPDIAPESPSPGIPLGQEVDCCCSEMGDLSFPDCSSFRPAHSSKQVKTAQQECLKEAVSQLQQVFQANTSTALNILGIRSIKAGHYRAAYICFKLAADQGYNKAQFNVGLCYEHGRGTKTALGKAALYYRHAARSGHLKAQYRYARCLLHYGSKAEKADLQKARTLLEQAAAAGLMEDSFLEFQQSVLTTGLWCTHKAGSINLLVSPDHTVSLRRDGTGLPWGTLHEGDVSCKAEGSEVSVAGSQEWGEGSGPPGAVYGMVNFLLK
ncbi:death ligand signal enhancer isoform X5 [Alligator mississippiensis]|uniref:death ligand signal enhancer isoform X5 n=1 Tax=Alligator mississippiensis TaxID=8496 RepID=UPI002877658B|nr:death ligand signal enhancer isoform X5 [Alligator mississippiensis]